MRQVPRYILAYLLWAVSIALGLLTANTVRSALLQVLDVIRSRAGELNQFSMLMQRNAIDRFGVVCMGVVLLGLIVGAEHLYRTGAQKGQLWRNFFLVTAILLAIWFVFDTVAFAVASSAGLLPVGRGLVNLLELALVVLFVWLYTRQKARPLLPG
jgi:hypothetical protein